jgi:circadian clock protein KaiB
VTEPDDEAMALVLYVVGASPASARAVANLAHICRTYLEDEDFELEIVDLYQQAERAAGDDVIAAPTLVRHLPLPVQQVVGDLSDERKVLLALGRAAPGAT